MLSASATNPKGDPVTDLRAEDVRVREDGKVQQIVFFRFAGSKRAIAPPAPGEFLNRPAPPPTFILFDRWNEKLMTAAGAWRDIGIALGRLESVDRSRTGGGIRAATQKAQSSIPSRTDSAIIE